MRILGISRIRENDSAAGRISLEEFLAGGTEGLPSFEGYKDLGRKFHHIMKSIFSILTLVLQIIMMKNQNSKFLFDIMTVS